MPLAPLPSPHLPTPHSPLPTPVSSLPSPHFPLLTPLSSLPSPHSPLLTPLSSLPSPHSPLPSFHSSSYCFYSSCHLADHRHSRKVIHAYPILRPPRQFVAINLDGERMYYVNAMESVISTIETQTISAKNIARLLAKSWGHPHTQKL